ncbi:D-alanyl-D-alanine carboxypeptidase family protein [Phaeovulum sp.]|uniref:D-alanyl-D-alanine carboxypeptidase family protein n=1 Tax=Phaeovulum sp. TaxID=2934796 RepID=UPI0039E4EAC6
MAPTPMTRPKAPRFFYAVLALAFASLLAALPAGAFETHARAAWVYDMTTDTVLLDKNADVALPPASMSKLMTVNMLFEALKDGRVSLDTRFPVSSKAKAMGGSTMFLNERDRPTVDELIKGIIVLSGNDACVVVAEGLAGSEAAFANQMTERAKALGMDNSSFANASGWPDPGQRMSMHDLGIVAVRLIKEFPELYKDFSITEYPFDNRAPDNRHNRNPLLKLGIGADGLKTGHTSEAGYGLVGSAVQGNRRIVFVISGLESEAARAQEAEAIVNWAFRQFVLKQVATKGTKLAQAPVWLGSTDSVGLVVGEDLSLLLPALAAGEVTGEATFSGPIAAPIAEGQELGQLVITLPGMPDTRVPLLAETAVQKGGFMVHMKTALAHVAKRALEALGS